MISQFVDEILYPWVKNRYTPDARWKDKPFSAKDVAFFSRGITELSEYFTTERPSRINDYLNHAKFRSSYLLYFLPLGIQKFDTVFAQYPGAFKTVLDGAASQDGILRVVDLGSGPGTASLAFLIHLLSRYKNRIPKKIEFYWLDLSFSMMKDGEQVLRAYVDQCVREKHAPGLEVTVHLTPGEWVRNTQRLPQADLVLMGQVLNEGKSSQDLESAARAIHQLKSRNRGGGVLLVEPAARVSSQFLSALRDNLIQKDPRTGIWGPCLHSGACPLLNGRDWCHFSVPVKPESVGKWFVQISKSLGSPREWSKYSYLWLSAPGVEVPKAPEDARLVISDPLGTSQGPQVLLCEPSQVRRYPLVGQKKLLRGERIRLAPLREPAAVKAGSKRRKR